MIERCNIERDIENNLKGLPLATTQDNLKIKIIVIVTSNNSSNKIGKH